MNWDGSNSALCRTVADKDDVQGCTSVAGAGCAGATVSVKRTRMYLQHVLQSAELLPADTSCRV
jgi:hypothetical protein